MKKSGWMLVVLIGISLGAYAQEATPRVDQRQMNQRARIRQGWANGDLTRRETARLMAAQRWIRRGECMAKADGDVTRAERWRLHRMQQRAHRDIARQRHDRQRMN